MALQFTSRPGGRKKLAALIATTLDAKAAYLGAPSFAYQIGQARLERDWTLTGLTEARERLILDASGAAGYDAQIEQVGLAIVLPTGDWDERQRANLRALLDSKGRLIAKALGADHVDVEFDDGTDTARFAWFGTLPDASVAEAATVLITQMVAYASRVQRANPTPPSGTNEKYVMRCFLLRLGFIGDHYQSARRLLLAGLDGNSAWRTPPAQHEGAERPTEPVVGSRVRLDANIPDEEGLVAGLEGRVFCIDAHGTIHVDWTNGSTTGLIPGRDQYTLLES